MTMLDRMRRHKGWLKWSLAIVALALVIFLVPEFSPFSSGVVSRAQAVADVSGTPITVGEYQRVLNNRLQQFRSQGGNLSSDMLKQLGIDRQVLQSLIDQRAVEAEARRRGISVTDAEVRAFILNMPAFQRERTIRRLRALPRRAAGAAAAAVGTRVRGRHPARPHFGEAAGRGHRLDPGVRRRGRRGIPAPQREGQARGRRAAGRAAAGRPDRHRRRHQGPLRQEHGRLTSSASGAKSGTCSSTRRACATDHPDAGGSSGSTTRTRSSSRTPSRCAPRTSCSRPRARRRPRSASRPKRSWRRSRPAATSRRSPPNTRKTR